MRGQPTGRAQDRLRAVRAAARHAFPTADIDQMLSEIERGYGDGPGLPGAEPGVTRFV